MFLVQLFCVRSLSGCLNFKFCGDPKTLGPVRLYRNKPGFVSAYQNLYKLEK
jgi:hypothetical protein